MIRVYLQSALEAAFQVIRQIADERGIEIFPESQIASKRVKHADFGIGALKIRYRSARD